MKKIRIEIKWAIMFSIAFLVWILLEKTMGWHDEKIEFQYYMRFLYIPISILFYILALKEIRRRAYKKSISWIKAFLNGLLLGLFIAILTPGVQYVIHNYISPDFLTNMINYSVDNNLMTESEALAEYNFKNHTIKAVIVSIIASVAASAIVAFVVERTEIKKKKKAIQE